MPAASQIFVRQVSFEGNVLSRPLTFYVGLNKEGRHSTTLLIRKHGGKVVDHSGDGQSNIIPLVDAKAKGRENSRVAYSVEYIKRCIDENKLLDLEQFRIPTIKTPGKKAFKFIDNHTSTDSTKSLPVVEVPEPAIRPENTPRQPKRKMPRRSKRKSTPRSLTKRKSPNSSPQKLNADTLQDAPDETKTAAEKREQEENAEQSTSPEKQNINREVAHNEDSDKDGDKNGDEHSDEQGDEHGDKHGDKHADKHADKLGDKHGAKNDDKNGSPSKRTQQQHEAAENQNKEKPWLPEEDAQLLELHADAIEVLKKGKKDTSYIKTLPFWIKMHKGKTLPKDREAHECHARFVQLQRLSTLKRPRPQQETIQQETLQQETPQQEEEVDEDMVTPRKAPKQSPNGKALHATPVPEQSTSGPGSSRPPSVVRPLQKNRNPSRIRKKIFKVISGLASRAKCSEKRAFRALRHEGGDWRRALSFIQRTRQEKG